MKFLQKLFGCCRSTRNENVPERRTYKDTPMRIKPINKNNKLKMTGKQLQNPEESGMLSLNSGNKTQLNFKRKAKPARKSTQLLSQSSVADFSQSERDLSEEGFDSVVEQQKKFYPDSSICVIEKDRQLKQRHELMQKVMGGSDNDKEKDDQFSKLMCPLCLKLMYKCMTTVCGHSFCERCIDEYMLIKSTCFVCDFDGKKGNTIRMQPLRSCFTLDDTIFQFVDKSDNQRLKDQWEVQMGKHDDWQKSKRLGDAVEEVPEGANSNSMFVGQKIDVRTRDYIWSEGTLRLIIEIVNQEPLLVVRFNGLLGHSDEIIVKSSGRLAKKGTYTDREDIPIYEKNELCLPRLINVYPSQVDTDNLKEQSDLPKTEIMSSSEVIPNSISQQQKPNSSTHRLSEEEVHSIKMEDQVVEQMIEDFFNQFEEQRVKDNQMQNWANQQVAANRPTMLRAVIENLNQNRGNPHVSGQQVLSNLMAPPRGQRAQAAPGRLQPPQPFAQQQPAQERPNRGGAANDLFDQLIRFTDNIGRPGQAGARQAPEFRIPPPQAMPQLPNRPGQAPDQPGVVEIQRVQQAPQGQPPQPNAGAAQPQIFNYIFQRDQRRPRQ